MALFALWGPCPAEVQAIQVQNRPCLIARYSDVYTSCVVFSRRLSSKMYGTCCMSFFGFVDILCKHGRLPGSATVQFLPLAYSVVVGRLDRVRARQVATLRCGGCR